MQATIAKNIVLSFTYTNSAPLLANRTSGVSYGIFKGLVGLAVRRRDMVVAGSGGRSTVGCYDRIVGCPGLHPMHSSLIFETSI